MRPELDAYCGASAFNLAFRAAAVNGSYGRATEWATFGLVLLGLEPRLPLVGQDGLRKHGALRVADRLAHGLPA